MLFVLAFFFFSMISTSVLAARFLGRSSLEMLPFGNLLIVVVLYLFGILGIPLKYGVIICALISVMSCLYICWGIVRDKRLFQNATDIIWILAFAIVYLVLIYLNYGRVASGIDEFSHWIECVKSMTYIDDFTTNSLSSDHFSSYPPGMALLQYYVQRLYRFIQNEEYRFNEWSTYFIYQVHTISFFAPIIQMFKPKRKMVWLLYLIAFLMTPTFFYSTLYCGLEIDQFLAISGGCTMAYVIWKEKLGDFEILYISLFCISIVLTKDTGMIFSSIVVILLVFRLILDNKTDIYNGRSKLIFFLPLVLLVSARLLWNHELMTCNIKRVGTNKVPIKDFINLVLFKRGNEFDVSVTEQFGSMYRDKCLLIILALCAMLILSYVIRRNKIDVGRRRFEVFAFSVIAVQYIGFVLGTLSVYLYQFAEYEARSLQAFDRYMNVELLAIYIVCATIWLRVVDDIEDNRSQRIFTVVGLLIFICLSDFNSLRNVISKQPVKSSKELRQLISELDNKLNEVCDGDDKIWYVARGDSGTHSGGYCLLFFNAMKFLAEPNSLDEPSPGWGLGPQLSENDIWYYDITAKQWMDMLIDEKYDYVAIWYAGDEFATNFGENFEADDDIGNNRIYRVDSDRRKLVICE